MCVCVCDRMLKSVIITEILYLSKFVYILFKKCLSISIFNIYI